MNLYNDLSKGGLGLGLAIVRSLVEPHGGSVSCRSDGLGRGSELIIELPAALGGADRAPPKAEAAAGQAGPAARPEARRRRRVLVVDDNVDAVEALAELLTELGYEARVAYDALSALEIAPQFEPDVCLLDIGLPVMDGYELAARLRGSELIAPGTRIVAITGYGQDADRRRAREAGFDAHVVKPVSIEALQAAIGGSG